MKTLKASNQKISTLLAFSLIPISGLALDVYIPSLPSMTADLHASSSAVQLTLSIFLITYGIAQLLIGSFLDSYGRYLPNLIALLGFSLASFIIAYTDSLTLIYVMRAIQGTMTAVIIVSKRAFFIDQYKGDQLKKYTSMFSIIWAAAPIIAPFLGGYLQVHFGWRSNFVFLGAYGILIAVLDLIYSGETVAKFSAFNLKAIRAAYSSMLTAADFTAGILVLGLSYGILLVYNMASPFIIEKLLHYPPTITGDCALISGISMLGGGLISKVFISHPLKRKMIIAVTAQLIAAIALILCTSYVHNIFTLIAYIVFVHVPVGFIFNGTLAYCLTRFPHHGGMASGLAGGGYIIFTSLSSYIIVNTVSIKSQAVLGIGYLTLVVAVFGLLVFTKWKQDKKIVVQEPILEEFEIG